MDGFKFFDFIVDNREGNQADDPKAAIDQLPVNRMLLTDPAIRANGKIIQQAVRPN